MLRLHCCAHLVLILGALGTPAEIDRCAAGSGGTCQRHQEASSEDTTSLLQQSHLKMTQREQHELATAQTSTFVLPDGRYYLENVKWPGRFFCGDGVDSEGDHHIWVGGEEDENKYVWNVTRQEDGSYKLSNAKWKGTLFCGDHQDSAGDRRVWVHKSKSYEKQGKERWRVEPQSDGTFKLFNQKWEGPLFCGDSTDSDGDRRIWVEPNVEYDGNGKERWRLKRWNSNRGMWFEVKTDCVEPESVPECGMCDADEEGAEDRAQCEQRRGYKCYCQSDVGRCYCDERGGQVDPHFECLGKPPSGFGEAKKTCD